MKATLVNPYRQSASITLEPIANYVHKKVAILWRKSVRAFIEKVSETLVVDTGMSVASLLPLAEEVRAKTTIIKAIAKGRGPIRAAYHGRGRFAGDPRFSDGETKKGKPRFERSKEHGEVLGRKAYTLKFGSIRAPKYKFEFKIKVLQYFLHENGLGGKHNWQSLQAGQDAFITVFDTGVEDILPAKVLMQYLTKGTTPFLGEDNG